jgi:hypothetical protein
LQYRIQYYTTNILQYLQQYCKSIANTIANIAILQYQQPWLTGISPDLYFEFHQPARSLRAPMVEYVLKTSLTFDSHPSYSFFYQRTDCWNHLPTKATQATTVYTRLIKLYQ